MGGYQRQSELRGRTLHVMSEYGSEHINLVAGLATAQVACLGIERCNLPLKTRSNLVTFMDWKLSL